MTKDWIQQLSPNDSLTRISAFIAETPLLYFPLLNEQLGFEIWLKPEMFHPVRAFKIRGAFNFLLKNRDAAPPSGVITHSSGNHGQALAYVGKQLEIPVTIVVPENAPEIKVKAMKKWGAKLSFCDSNVVAREESCANIQLNEGQLFVPPYDHPDIIEGASTAALEAFNQHQFDAVICPVGGGGLLAGSSLAAKQKNSNCLIYAAEPKNANDAYLGFKAGKREKLVTPNTIADGLRTTVGHYNFQVISEMVDDIWLCTEAEIHHWGRTMLSDYNILIEPSSATVFAAMMNNKKTLRGKKVLAILSGGNVASDFYSANG